jgi:hypothetical protein
MKGEKIQALESLRYAKIYAAVPHDRLQRKTQVASMLWQ